MLNLINTNKAVGLKQSYKAVNMNLAKLVYVAEDADSHIRLPFVNLCRNKNVKIEFVQSKKELGIACGIEVATAFVAVLK